MMSLGDEGYLKHTKSIMEATQLIADGVAHSIPGLKLYGQPEAMIVCFGSKIILR